MKLSEIFTKKAITAGPQDTLASIAKTLKEHHVGAVVIVNEGRPVGIVTDRDLALALGVEGFTLQTPAQEIMTRHVLAIPDDSSILAATQFIRECRVRRLPIVDSQDCVVGMVSLDDLLRLLVRELYNLGEGIKGEVEVR